MRDKIEVWIVSIGVCGLVSFLLIQVLVDIYGESDGWLLYLIGLFGFIIMIVFVIGVKSWIDPLLEKLIKRMGWD